jgi:hypothetical protein
MGAGQKQDNKKILAIKEQLSQSGLIDQIKQSDRLHDFLHNIKDNPEFSKVFIEFHRDYIEHHKRKLLQSADGEIDQVFNGNLNVLKQVLSPIEYGDIYIKYQQEEQKFAVDSLIKNKSHFQNLIIEEQDKIAEIVNANPEYAKTPKFLEVIENNIEVVGLIQKYEMSLQAAELPKSGKRSFELKWDKYKRKRDLILMIALLEEEHDSEKLDAMHEMLAIKKQMTVSVGGVTKAVFENFDEISKTGAVTKTFAQIASEWSKLKTKDISNKTPPTDITYAEVLIANVVGGKSVGF